MIRRYVPQEDMTFEISPRQHLNDLVLLISKLRGGQQRYLPLLVTKIGDTMPCVPGYSLPLPFIPSRESSGLSEAYERSSVQSSPPLSGIGSPPMSAIGPAPPGFGTFQHEMGADSPATLNTFQNLVMSAGISYGEISLSGAVPVFEEPEVYTPMDEVSTFV